MGEGEGSQAAADGPAGLAERGRAFVRGGSPGRAGAGSHLRGYASGNGASACLSPRRPLPGPCVYGIPSH